MTINPCFIDTNIIMYARGKEHTYKTPCTQLILTIADGSFADRLGEPVTDTEVFQEVMYRYGAEERWETGVSVCRQLRLIGLRVLPVSAEEVDSFISLAEKYGGRGVTARDLIHVAVMVNHGIRRIISTDTHFDLVDEVERIDPVNLQG